MKIQLPLPYNSICERSIAFYNNFSTIINYSNLNDSSKKVALKRLESIHKDFLENHTINLKELHGFLARAVSLVYWTLKEGGCEVTLNEVKRFNSIQEGIVGWLFRYHKDLDPTLILRDKKEIKNPVFSGNHVHLIENKPMNLFSNDMTKEWLRILENDIDKQPIWYNELPVWQKKIFQEAIILWLNRNEVVSNYNNSKPDELLRMPIEGQLKIMTAFQNRVSTGTLDKMNLGELMGPQPGCHVLYPSLRMAYTNSAYSYSSNKAKEISLFRRTTFCRMAIPSVILKDGAEQLRITKMNIEQSILYGLPFNFFKVSKIFAKYLNEIPILFQYVPGNHNFLPGKSLLKIMNRALNTLNEDIGKASYCRELIEKNMGFINLVGETNSAIKAAEEIKDCKNIAFKIFLLSHDDVCNENSEKISLQSNEAVIFLKKYLCEGIKNTILVGGEKIDENNKNISRKTLKHIEDCKPEKVIDDICSLPDETEVCYLISSFKVSLDAFVKFQEGESIAQDENRVVYESFALEKAAYLQIAFSGVGMSYVCCENGCNGSSPLSLVINALRALYLINGKFPSYLKSADGALSPERRELYEIVTDHIIEGYCQSLHDRNSQGCFGIANFSEIFGHTLLTMLSKKLVNYGIHRSSEYLNYMYNEISELENANYHGCLKKNKDVIVKEMKSLNLGSSDDLQDNNWVSNYRSYLMPNSDELIGNKIFKFKLDEKVKNLIGLPSASQLIHLIKLQNAEDNPELKSTASRLRKFKSDFRNNTDAS